jgi:hypothetical protein
MKHRTLEPGLLQVLKFLVVFQVLGVLFVRLPLAKAMGVEVTLVCWLWGVHAKVVRQRGAKPNVEHKESAIVH